MSRGDSNTGHIQLPTSSKSGKADCSICGEVSDGFHFGAEACRACAAFFRRTVSLGKKYVCRTNGNCEITSNVRCMCRACRYSKCIKVGMKTAGVQQRRDTHGKHCTPTPSDERDTSPVVSALLSLKQENEPSSSSPVFNNMISSSEGMPILERMYQNYTQMENSRAVIHRREGESLIMPKVPRSITCKDSAQVIEKEVPLVFDWISCCFDDFANLPCDKKQVLFGNFFMNFIMLQYAYFCHINNRDDVIIIASGDYIDLNNLHDFYRQDSDSPGMISTEEAVRLFRRSFEAFRTSMIHQMMQQNVDLYEFFVLCTCALWEIGLDGQSDQCIEIGRIVKEKVLKELLFYLQNIRKVDNPPIRIAMLLTLLPALNRAVKKFQENIELSNVFNFNAVPAQLYKIVNGKFI